MGYATGPANGRSFYNLDYRPLAKKLLDEWRLVRASRKPLLALSQPVLCYYTDFQTETGSCSGMVGYRDVRYVPDAQGGKSEETLPEGTTRRRCNHCGTKGEFDLRQHVSPLNC